MDQPARYPGQAPIESYGNGGFRFAGMSHRGSLLSLPGQMCAWDAAGPEAIDTALITLVAAAEVDVLILGTGRTFVIPRQDIRHAFQDAGIVLEFMDTGAAVRTYNILLSEERKVGAALIAAS